MCTERSRPRWRTLGLACAIVGALAGSAPALIMVISGDQPWHNESTPQGSQDVANLPTRIGGWEGPPFGGGHYHFSYICEDTDDFNAALRALAEIRAPRVELFVHDGPGRDFMLDHRQGEKRKGLLIDWSFSVWVPENFHRLYNNPVNHFSSDQESFRQPVPAPRMDVYLRGDGPIDWSLVTLPPQITVIDRRASAAPIKPDNGSVVEAFVYDMATGRPVRRAKLTLSSVEPAESAPEELQGDADEDGRILVKNIPWRAFNVHIHAPDFAPRACRSIHGRVDAYHRFDVELCRAANISGVVVDDEGKPVQGVKVVAWQIMGIDGRGYGQHSGLDQPFAETDDAGHFQIYPLPRGYAGLRIESPSYHAPFVPLMAVPANDVRIQVTATGTVRGTVIFPEGGLRPKDLHVSISAPGDPGGKYGGDARCGEDNSFEFTRVPPGEYFLHCPARMPGRNNDDGVRVTVRPGAVAQALVPYR